MSLNAEQLQALMLQIRRWSSELGFSGVAVSDTDLSIHEPGLQAWLDAGYHGDMHYMESHGMKRARPAELVPGTIRVLSLRMDYLPADQGWRERERARQNDASQAVISVYARGRDYHKVLRQRLQQLADKIASVTGPFGHRVFTDSAPVMEVALAARSGLGWRGKHTLLLNRDAGSMFFLGEIFTDLALPVDDSGTAHCGQCHACIDACPTGAIVAPYQVDARRCISYLTIESGAAIPLELRPLIGNRIYGCDDCQLACPWNKFAQKAVVSDFDVRHSLDNVTLTDLFGWSEEQFLRHFEGSPVRRIGYESWLRNLAVGLGNAAVSMRGDPRMVAALQARTDHPSELVREHVQWALEQHLQPG